MNFKKFIGPFTTIYRITKKFSFNLLYNLVTDIIIRKNINLSFNYKDEKKLKT